ncbi:MAG: DUF4177 domain-containing protein [Anaerolineae bacterium]|nr:DUF4177 domain-containing protein [Anaerolineae bacterium]
MSASIQWEYRVQSVGKFWGAKDEEIETLLNEWGEEGWEVVTVFSSSGSGNVMAVAKRPLTLATRRRRSMPGIEEMR